MNSRGSADGLQDALGKVVLTTGSTTWQVRAQVRTVDVTGDTTPDAVVALTFFVEGQYADGAVFVYSCRAGRYQGGAVAGIAGQVLSAGDADPGLRAVQDLNQDGVPEIVFSYIEIAGTHANFTRVFRILEWDGRAFVDLIRGPGYDPDVAAVLNGDGVIGDTDGDGDLELVLTNGIGRGPELHPLERPRTDVYAWDGGAFVLACSESPPPTYRIHAVQDGDRATRCGQHDRALAAYQRAIFDESLLGWSRAQVLDPAAPPEPEERARLSAYSRYRILLLHVDRGYLPEARIVYDTLQAKFPSGAVGHAYAQLAAAFWAAYQAGPDVGAACAKAIEYAAAHDDEILNPLGRAIYGDGQLGYTPSDICPLP